MIFKLLDNARRLAENLTIPVPEQVINAVLPQVVKDVKEVRRICIAVRDGTFDVKVRLNKEVLLMDMNADVSIRFTVEAARISADEQWVKLRQDGPLNLRGHDVIDKIAAAVAEAILFSLLDIDPVEAAVGRLPNIQRDGDCYRIDLSTMLPADWNDHLRKPWMRLGHVHAISCRPNRFELVVAVGTRTTPNDE